jgi:hypothetical protein
LYLDSTAKIHYSLNILDNVQLMSYLLETKTYMFFSWLIFGYSPKQSKVV